MKFFLLFLVGSQLNEQGLDLPAFLPIVDLPLGCFHFPTTDFFHFSSSKVKEWKGKAMMIRKKWSWSLPWPAKIEDGSQRGGEEES